MRMSRVIGGLFAACVMVLSQAVGISPAHAAIGDPACRYDHVTYNACLRFRHLGGDDPNVLNVLVGLDRSFPEEYAKQILAGGANFRGRLWAVGRAQPLANLTLAPGWPAVSGDNLGVEMTADVSRYTLNVRNGVEELYATITFFDSHPTAHDETYTTGSHRAEFAPIIITPPGPECLVVVPC